jgi:hypothetical protein
MSQANSVSLIAHSSLLIASRRQSFDIVITSLINPISFLRIESLTR